MDLWKSIEARAKIAREVCSKYRIYSLAYLPSDRKLKEYQWTEPQIDAYRDQYEKATLEFNSRCEKKGLRIQIYEPKTAKPNANETALPIEPFGSETVT